MRAALLLLALAGCATGPGRGDDEGPPIGAAARAHSGADPVSVPPAGVGEAEDPSPAEPR